MLQKTDLLLAWAGMSPLLGQPLQDDSSARQQLDELLDRSLIMQRPPDSNWDVVTYQMHPLLRHLAVQECKISKRQKVIIRDQTWEECVPKTECKV